MMFGQGILFYRYRLLFRDIGSHPQAMQIAILVDGCDSVVAIAERGLCRLCRVEIVNIDAMGCFCSDKADVMFGSHRVGCFTDNGV